MKITEMNEANHKADDQLWQKRIGIWLLILVAISLFAGTIPARAQTTVELPQLVLESNNTEYVNTGNRVSLKFTWVKSSNPSVARAFVYRVTTQDTDLFNNFNTGGTVNGPRRRTVFTLNRPARITELVTYHWNSGRGAMPGTINLRDQNGKIYGPFAAFGSSGQGGAADVNWVAKANVTVPAGTYTLLDSNPRTWSNNSQSGFAGFEKVRGYLLQSPLSLPQPIARPETQTNLIQNGSFEVGPDPGPFGTYSAGATSITGWRVTTRTIDYIGSYWPASHGKRSVDLDGTPGAGGIAQSFATIPRQEYVVTFDLAGNPEVPPPVKKLQVNAAGQSAEFSFDISGKSKSDMGWQRKTWRFRANEATTTIEFLSLGDAASRGGPVIDNIWVVAAKPLLAEEANNPGEPVSETVPQDGDARKCVWNRHGLGKDTNVTSVTSDHPTIVEVQVDNFAAGGGFKYHCRKGRGTALITYKYTDVNGNQEGKLRVICNE
jgi:choice-of-anchor C domain-containing protein